MKGRMEEQRAAEEPVLQGRVGRPPAPQKSHLMASLQAVFKNLAVKDKMGPAELIDELNRYLCGNTQNGQFATFLYGILDVHDSTFTFSHAGQKPARLIKDN